MEKQTVRLIICIIGICSGFGALPAIGWLIFGAMMDEQGTKKATK